MSRPSLGLTPEEMATRRLEQARDAKRRRKAFLDSIKAEGGTPCKSTLCLEVAGSTGYCARHSAPAPKSKDRECTVCGGIAMPRSRLCGYHSEEAEERRAATRQKNRSKRNARMNGEAA